MVVSLTSALSRDELPCSHLEGPLLSSGGSRARWEEPHPQPCWGAAAGGPWLCCQSHGERQDWGNSTTFIYGLFVPEGNFTRRKVP